MKRFIAKDPSFAPAYAGLAAAYAAVSAQGVESGHGEDLTRMRAAAEKAIRLDPLLAEAHEALAMEYARDGQWAQAERSFRRALELNPSDSPASCDMTMYVLLPLGRLDEALMRAAETADPLAPFIQDILGWTLIFTGRYEEAVSHCQKAVRVPECLGRARLGQGRIDEAIRILDAGKSLRYLGYAYGRAGRREEAEKLAVAVAPNALVIQSIAFTSCKTRDHSRSRAPLSEPARNSLLVGFTISASPRRRRGPDVPQPGSNGSTAINHATSIRGSNELVKSYSSSTTRHKRSASRS